MRNAVTFSALAAILGTFSPVAQAGSGAELVQAEGVSIAVRRPQTGPAPHVAIIYENGRSEFHPMCTELAQRGFLTLCAIEGDNRQGAWESVARDVKAAVEYARRQPGITKVVIYGHSGGGAVGSFYQAVAENGVAFCKNPRKLSICNDDLANLPPVDAMLFPDAHPGLGVMAVRHVNPSLSTDGLKVSVNPELDPYDPKNGFNPHGPSHYSPQFQAKYAKAQAAAMEELIRQAQSIRAKVASGAITDPAADKVVTLAPKLTNHLDESDPTAVGLMSTSKPRRLLRNDGTIVTQIIHSASVGHPQEASRILGPPDLATVPFLSRGAVHARDAIDDIDYCTSNSVTVCNVQSIHVPSLFIAAGAGTFIADGERMYERSAAKDKEFIVVEGAEHGGAPCTPCEKTPGEFANSAKNQYDYIRAWINKRF